MITNRSVLTGAAPFAALLLSIVSLCVGTSFAKVLFPVAGAAGMTALRIGLSALLLIGVQRPWRWRLDRAQGQAVAVYGVVLACMNLSFYQALTTLPLGVATAIEFLGPLGVAIAYSRSRIDLIWAMLAATGIAALVLPGTGGQSIALSGVGFALIAAACWALYILAGKRATMVVPERQIVCLGLCVAALIAVPAGVAQAGSALLDRHVFVAGIAVAILCSALPYSLEMFSLKRLPRHVFGIVVSMEPAVGAIAAFAILGERLALLQWLGLAGVIAASVGSSLGRQLSQRGALPAL